MTAHSIAAERCNNYYLLRLPPVAKAELAHLLENRGLLKCRASLILILEPHSTGLLLKCNRLCLPELVILFTTLHDYGLLSVKHNHGFWSALQKHLVDFDGMPIRTRLGRLAKSIASDPEAYEAARRRVMKVIDKVMKKAAEYNSKRYPSGNAAQQE